MSIGERLREEREARGLTQLVLADLASSSERTVNDWERDVSSPKASALAALAAHGLDVRYIVTGSRDYVPPPGLSAEEQEVIGLWRAASRDTKNAVMGALTGGGAKRPAKQVFHGFVGQVIKTKGPVTIESQRFDLRSQRTPKKP